MSTKLGISNALKPLVTDKFHQAKQAKDVVFSETQLTFLQSHGIGTFQLRYLPKLASKPLNNNSRVGPSSDVSPQIPSDKPKPKFDPFENPSNELLVIPVPVTRPSHNLVLNKFPVIANHFILATKENKPQDHPLEADDVSLTYECIKAWREVETRGATNGVQSQSSTALFAFFNSGSQSGASQPHRHVQFLPVEDMNSHDSNIWSLLVDSMTTRYRPQFDLLINPALSIVHYAIVIQPDISPQELHEKYIHLLRASWATLAHGTADIDPNDLKKCDITQIPDKNYNSTTKSIQDEAANQSSDGKVGFDYNLCLTIDRMAIIPRLQADAQIPLPNSEDDNRLSVNGTVLAGTLMTKSQKQWQTLKEEPEILADLLNQVGFPTPAQSSL